MLRNSIRKASSPFRIAGGFLGMFLFDYEKFYFNRLYMIAIWTLYASTINHLRIFFREQGQFTSILGILTLHAAWVITFVTASFNAGYKKSSDKCFQALCIADETLKSLGVSSEYQTIYRESLITFTLLLVVSAGISIFTLISIVNLYSWQHMLCMRTMFDYPRLLTNISDFNYRIILRSIEARFDRLNQYMDDLSADRENHGRTFSKNTRFILKSRRNDNSRNDQSNVWIIMKLHRQLNKTSREINRMFGVDFGLQMGVFFFTTIEYISSLYLVYVKLNQSAMQRVLIITAYITAPLLHFMKIVFVNCACENIQRKSNAMEAALTNFINTVHDFESSQEIHQFLMQVKYRPLQFTALGFINLGYECLTSMCTSMAEITIIMIQLGAISHANYVHSEDNTTTND